jgi:hypothetical protein
VAWSIRMNRALFMTLSESPANRQIEVDVSTC